MADRPRLFSAPMVRALLARRKTETRRLLSPQNVRFLGSDGRSFAPSKGLLADAQKEILDFRRVGPADAPVWIWKGPAYSYQPGPYTNWHCHTVDQVGDRLWVREAWAPLSACISNDPGTAALASGRFYRADYGEHDEVVSRWKPSIHMPHQASRLTLEVTGVFLERLHEITDSDAEAEGMYQRVISIGDRNHRRWFNGLDDDTPWPSPRAAYQTLWCRLHSPTSWNANPLVIVTAFDVHLCNIDKMEPAT